MYRQRMRPSAVRPEMAMPMWSSILKTLRWYEESSEGARFNVAMTACVSLCKYDDDFKVNIIREIVMF